MRAKLREVKTELRRRRHHPIPDQGRWLAASCAGTSPTTPCPTTATRSARSATRSSGTGSARSAPQPTITGDLGTDATASPTAGCPPPASCIPGPTRALTPEPKAGAQCVRRARWDLRGGPPARAVPTAILNSPLILVRLQIPAEPSAADQSTSATALRASLRDRPPRVNSQPALQGQFSTGLTPESGEASSETRSR